MKCVPRSRGSAHSTSGRQGSGLYRMVDWPVRRTLQLSLVFTLSLAALCPRPLRLRLRESKEGQVCLSKPGEEL